MILAVASLAVPSARADLGCERALARDLLAVAAPHHFGPATATGRRLARRHVLGFESTDLALRARLRGLVVDAGLGTIDHSADAAFVLTHQIASLAAASVRAARAVIPPGVPTLRLISAEFPLPRRLAARPGALQYSAAGELGDFANLNVGTVYLGGGVDVACLARTIRDLVRGATRHGRAELTVHLLANSVYYLLPGDADAYRAPARVDPRTLARQFVRSFFSHRTGDEDADDMPHVRPVIGSEIVDGSTWRGEFVTDAGLRLHVVIDPS